MRRTLARLLAAGLLAAILAPAGALAGQTTKQAGPQPATTQPPRRVLASGPRTCWFLVARGDGLRRLHGCTQEVRPVGSGNVYQEVTLAVYLADDIHLATDCETLTANRNAHFNLLGTPAKIGWQGASALGTCRAVWQPAPAGFPCTGGNWYWGMLGDSAIGGVGASWRDPAGPHFWYGWKDQSDDQSQILKNC